MYRNLSITFLLVIVSTFAATQAHAIQRTHVSAAIGDDANTAANCTPVAPCRTFQAAMTVTDSNGEVVVLDSGGYGAVTITQSVALIAPKGVYAGISVFPDANGVTISGGSSINVVLRGLNINGQGGNYGIRMLSGSRLSVQNCVISNLALSGIWVSGAIIVRVNDTIIRDNGDSGILLQDNTRTTITRAIISGHINSAGIAVQGFAGAFTTADIADSSIDGNSDGVNAKTFNSTGTVKVSVRDSRIVRNTKVGLKAESSAGTSVSLSASNNIVSHNQDGIVAFNVGTKVWASGNTVSNNSVFGLENFNGAIFQTAGNNAVRNNQLDVSGTIPIASTK